MLPLRPLSHLFLLDNEFSAAPDVGWPDIFNSGVMVLSPGEDKFEELRELLNTKGSWDAARIRVFSTSEEVIIGTDSVSRTTARRQPFIRQSYRALRPAVLMAI